MREHQILPLFASLVILFPASHYPLFFVYPIQVPLPLVFSSLPLFLSSLMHLCHGSPARSYLFTPYLVFFVINFLSSPFFRLSWIKSFLLSSLTTNTFLRYDLSRLVSFFPTRLSLTFSSLFTYLLYSSFFFPSLKVTQFTSLCHASSQGFSFSYSLLSLTFFHVSSLNSSVSKSTNICFIWFCLI